MTNRTRRALSVVGGTVLLGLALALPRAAMAGPPGNLCGYYCWDTQGCINVTWALAGGPTSGTFTDNEGGNGNWGISGTLIVLDYVSGPADYFGFWLASLGNTLGVHQTQTNNGRWTGIFPIDDTSCPIIPGAQSEGGIGADGS